MVPKQTLIGIDQFISNYYGVIRVIIFETQPDKQDGHPSLRRWWRCKWSVILQIKKNNFTLCRLKGKNGTEFTKVYVLIVNQVTKTPPVFLTGPLIRP